MGSYRVPFDRQCLVSDVASWLGRVWSVMAISAALIMIMECKYCQYLNITHQAHHHIRRVASSGQKYHDPRREWSTQINLLKLKTLSYKNVSLFSNLYKVLGQQPAVGVSWWEIKYSCHWVMSVMSPPAPRSLAWCPGFWLAGQLEIKSSNIGQKTRKSYGWRIPSLNFQSVDLTKWRKNVSSI